MKVRDYTMRARKESVELTRLRITEATVRLHERVGPASTTVSAIAEEAGVTRLTVYRHFPDEDALVSACSAHWGATHPAPDPARWRRVRNPEERLARALAETYVWWGDAEPMMSKVLRDLDRMPGFVRDHLEQDGACRVELLSRGFATTRAGRRRVRAVVAHALSLPTWRSLCEQGGLTQDQAARLMVGLARDAAGPVPRPIPTCR